MAALGFSIVANIAGKEVPWEDVSPELKKRISTKLLDDAMIAAGYRRVQNEHTRELERIYNLQKMD